MVEEEQPKTSCVNYLTEKCIRNQIFKTWSVTVVNDLITICFSLENSIEFWPGPLCLRSPSSESQLISQIIENNLQYNFSGSS